MGGVTWKNDVILKKNNLVLTKNNLIFVENGLFSYITGLNIIFLQVIWIKEHKFETLNSMGGVIWQNFISLT